MSNPNQFVLVDDDTLPTEHERQGMTWCRDLPAGLMSSYLNGAPNHQKEQRLKRNLAAAHMFARSILNHMDCSTLIERVLALFDASMAQGHFKWGRHARCVVGASIMIAVRENGLAFTIKDIAARLGISTHTLGSTVLQILSLHNMRVKTAEPLNFVPAIIRDLAALNSRSDVEISTRLRTLLSPINWHAIETLALDLCYLIEVEFLAHNRAAPPVASALVLVALEGEVGRALPSLPELASLVSRMVQVHPDTIIDRYYEIQQLFSKWKGGLPWVVSKPERKSKRNITISQREEHAGLIKDIVAFQDELHRDSRARENCAGSGKAPDNVQSGHTAFIPLVIEEGSDDDGLLGDESGLVQSSKPSAVSTPTLQTVKRHPDLHPGKSSDEPPRKRRRGVNAGGLELASKLRENETCLRPSYAQGRSRRQRLEDNISSAASTLLGGGGGVAAVVTGNGNSGGASFRRRLLADGVDATAAGRPPQSRLGMLGMLVGESNVSDEMLFDDGEMECYLRDEDEVELARRHWETLHPEGYPVDVGTPSTDDAIPARRTKTVDFLALRHALSSIGVDDPEANDHWDEVGNQHEAALTDSHDDGSEMDSGDTLASFHDVWDFARATESIAYDPFEEFEEV